MIRGQQTGRATEEKRFDKEAEMMFVDRKDRTKSRCLIVEPTHGGTFRDTGKKGFCGQWWATEMVSLGLKRTKEHKNMLSEFKRWLYGGI